MHVFIRPVESARKAGLVLNLLKNRTIFELCGEFCLKIFKKHMRMVASHANVNCLKTDVCRIIFKILFYV